MKEQYLPKTPEGRRYRLAEECAEVIVEVSKCGRFGVNTVCPAGCGDDSGTTPRERLLAEIDDLEHAIAAVREDLLGPRELLGTDWYCKACRIKLVGPLQVCCTGHLE